MAGTSKMKITKSQLRRIIEEEQLKELLEEEISGLPLENLVGGIAGLVDGMPPEDVSDVFEKVFRQLPGVELQMHDAPEEEEEATSRQMIGFDRGEEEEAASAGQQIGFREQLVYIIQEEIRQLMEVEYDDEGPLYADAQEDSATPDDAEVLVPGYGGLEVGQIKRRIAKQLAAAAESAAAGDFRRIGSTQLELLALFLRTLEEHNATDADAPMMEADYRTAERRPSQDAIQTLASAGIAEHPESVRKEIIDLIMGLDTGDPEDMKRLADMAASLLPAAGENIKKGYGLE